MAFADFHQAQGLPLRPFEPDRDDNVDPMLFEKRLQLIDWTKYRDAGNGRRESLVDFRLRDRADDPVGVSRVPRDFGDELDCPLIASENCHPPLDLVAQGGARQKGEKCRSPDEESGKDGQVGESDEETADRRIEFQGKRHPKVGEEPEGGPLEE